MKTTEQSDIRSQVRRSLEAVGFGICSSSVGEDAWTDRYTPSGLDYTRIQGRNARHDRVDIKAVSITFPDDREAQVTVSTEGAYIPYRCSKPRLPWDGGHEPDIEAIQKECIRPLVQAVSHVPTIMDF